MGLIFWYRGSRKKKVHVSDLKLEQIDVVVDNIKSVNYFFYIKSNNNGVFEFGCIIKYRDILFFKSKL